MKTPKIKFISLISIFLIFMPHLAFAGKSDRPPAEGCERLLGIHRPQGWGYSRATSIAAPAITVKKFRRVRDVLAVRPLPNQKVLTVGPLGLELWDTTQADRAAGRLIEYPLPFRGFGEEAKVQGLEASGGNHYFAVWDSANLGLIGSGSRHYLSGNLDWMPYEIRGAEMDQAQNFLVPGKSRAFFRKGSDQLIVLAEKVRQVYFLNSREEQTPDYQAQVKLLIGTPGDPSPGIKVWEVNEGIEGATLHHFLIVEPVEGLGSPQIIAESWKDILHQEARENPGDPIVEVKESIFDYRQFLFMRKASGQLSVVDIPFKLALTVKPPPGANMSFFEISPNGRYMLVGYSDGTLEGFDLETPKGLPPPWIQKLPFGDKLRGATFSPDSQLVLVAGEGQTARLIFLEKGQKPPVRSYDLLDFVDLRLTLPVVNSYGFLSNGEVFLGTDVPKDVQIKGTLGARDYWVLGVRP